MAQNLLDTQIDNLAIAVADAAGNAISPLPAFDNPPQWGLTDGTTTATLTPSADGLTAVLTPATVGTTVTVSVAAVIGGTTFKASLDVTISSGAGGQPVPASISIVATPAPKPA